VVTWSTDALWLGPAIVTRLRTELPDLRSVRVMDDLTPDDKPAQMPAAVVLLQGLRPDTAPDGRRYTVAVEADWVVAIVVDSRRADSDAQRQVAGPIITQVVAALHGWQADGLNRPLAWVPGAPRPYFTRNFSAYPLLLRARFSTRSESMLPPLT
jgi:hypothetical protein